MIDNKPDQEYPEEYMFSGEKKTAEAAVDKFQTKRDLVGNKNRLADPEAFAAALEAVQASSKNAPVISQAEASSINKTTNEATVRSLRRIFRKPHFSEFLNNLNLSELTQFYLRIGTLLTFASFVLIVAINSLPTSSFPKGEVFSQAHSQFDNPTIQIYLYDNEKHIETKKEIDLSSFLAPHEFIGQRTQFFKDSQYFVIFEMDQNDSNSNNPRIYVREYGRLIKYDNNTGNLTNTDIEQVRISSVQFSDQLILLEHNQGHDVEYVIFSPIENKVIHSFGNQDIISGSWWSKDFIFFFTRDGQANTLNIHTKEQTPLDVQLEELPNSQNASDVGDVTLIPDKQLILFTDLSNINTPYIYTFHLDTRLKERIAEADFFEVSPDGKRIAYVDMVKGTLNLYSLETGQQQSIQMQMDIESLYWVSNDTIVYDIDEPAWKYYTFHE